MKRLKRQAEIQPLQEFINKYHNNSGQANFMEFRKAFVKQFENKIKEYPLLNTEISDYGYEGGNGVELLYSVYNQLMGELDYMDIDDIYDLIENEIHDFWTEIPDLYKTEL